MFARHNPPPADYRAYTTAHDLELRGEQLGEFLGAAGAQAFKEYAAGYDQGMGSWRAAADITAMNSVQSVKSATPSSILAETVAALLIDHSGSMRGQRAIIATALAEIVAEYWNRLGIAYELLGFTTSSWQGGNSRKAWERAGRPANPGRLCDLLHIIYRSADETNPGAPWAIRNVMRRELLKENIDGEAVVWAARRLRERPQRRKILLVVSDGAPVDDSTIAANDPEILVRHLKQTIAELEQSPDFCLGAIGIDYSVSHYYSTSTEIGGLEDLAARVVPFLEQLLKASAPPPTG
jgi:cobaltochelatase CobT